MKRSRLIRKIRSIALILIFLIIPEKEVKIYPVSQNERQITVIKNVNVIPMTENRILKDQNVLIQDRKIIAIVPSELDIPKDVTVINGRGRYLMPGMADMHVHLNNRWPVSDLNLYIANGVTTIRDLNGSPYMLKWKTEIRNGERLGPNLYVSCPIIYGYEPDVLLLANQCIKNKYDCMKIYSFF